MTQKARIGDKLVEKGYITNEQLEKALSLQKETGKRVGEILIEQGNITAELLTNVLTELLNIQNAPLTKSTIDPRATKLIPENICKRYKIIPYKIEDNKLHLAMADPQDRSAIQDVKRIADMDIAASIATIGDINNAISFSYVNADLDKAISEYVKIEKPKEEILIDDDVNEAPIVRLVQSVLESAVRTKASDIHIEQDGDFMRIRFRIDGILTEHMKLSAKPYKAIVSRIKIMAGFNISEKRLRQDPDIIMVEEIRDYDTAEIAIRASLTGHLVLSTLHSNTAVGAISRLLDMNIDSFLITSSLIGVISQRLIRKICPDCKYSMRLQLERKEHLE